MPTLLSLSGLECPDVDGKDLSEVFLGGESDQQDAVLIMKLLQGGNPYKINAVMPWRAHKAIYIHNFDGSRTLVTLR